MFFADFITFKMPVATPIKKKLIVNHGLVPNQLSKINPNVVPTTTAATNSVLIFKALPKDAAFEPLSFIWFFFIFFLQSLSELIFYLNPSLFFVFRQPIPQPFVNQLKLVG